MYQVTMEVICKRDIDRKETYEKTAKLIRLFINLNNKELKKEHYLKQFSYYTFSNFSPLESAGVYKKGRLYTVELRSLKKEFLEMKYYGGLETDELRMVAVSSGKLYYRPSGKLTSETPVFFRTKRIETEAYERQVKDEIRENILYRYVKSGLNKSDDLDELRQSVISSIEINPKVITIPFEEKRLKNGNPLLYHCFHLALTFQDTEEAKQAEQILYASGIGKNTSNGFGLMREG